MLVGIAEKIAGVIYGKEYVEENDRLKIAIMAVMMSTVPLMITIVVLAFGYFNLANSMEVKMRFPGVTWADDREASFGYSKSNEFAYELFGRFVVQELGEFDTSDVEHRMHKVIGVMWPNDYAKYQDVIKQFETSVKSERVSLQFKAHTHKVELFESGHKATYTAKGVAVVDVGGEKKAPKQCEFKVNMMTAGEMYVRSFSTDCI